MTQDHRNIPDYRNISRRTLTRGALWSVPVVTAATEVPVYAASYCPTPAVPPLDASHWTVADLSPGQHNVQPGTGFVASSSWYWSRDDVRRGATSASVETLTSTMNIVAGCTYRFNLVAIKIQNNGNNQPDHTDQQLDFQVDRTTVIQATTGPTTDTKAGLTPSIQQLTGAFTATRTGAVPLVFVFTLLAPVSGHYGNDDIRISDLTVTAT